MKKIGQTYKMDHQTKEIKTKKCSGERKAFVQEKINFFFFFNYFFLEKCLSFFSHVHTIHR